MADFMCLVKVMSDFMEHSENSDDRLLGPVYLVDQQSYFLLCSLQPFKVNQKVLNKILDWLVDNKQAIKLSRMPHHLTFDSKNSVDDGSLFDP